MKAAILKLKLKTTKQLISQKHACIHKLLTTAIFVQYVNNHSMGLFYKYCTKISSITEKKINIHRELVTSQPH